jgi:hypothetical protein
MSGHQTSASRDAQARRDAEKDARDSLKSLIPDEYFNRDAQAQSSGKESVSSRIMKAAESYIHVLMQEKLDLAEEQPGSPLKSPKGKGKGKEKEKAADATSKKRKSMAEELDEDQGAGPSVVIPSRREHRTRADERRHNEMVSITNPYPISQPEN